LIWFYCNANNCKIKKNNIHQYVKLWYSMWLYFNITYWIKYNTFLVSFTMSVLLWEWWYSNLSFIHNQLMFDDNYFRQMCVFVHPILTQSQSNQIPCTYVFEVTLHMCLQNDDFSSWYWITKLHKNPYTEKNTTGASTFSTK
jgi:hypothetical protein